jgi:MFS family permease
VELKALAANRNYVALWVGQSVSWIGNAFHRISLLFLLMEGLPEAQRHVPLLLLMLFYAAAHLLVGPFAGVFVDRWNRKTAMIAADLARAALVLLIPFAPGRPWLYVLSFLVTVATLFFEPARHSSLPIVVPEKQLYLANSVLNASESGAEVIGLLGGGVLVGLLGYRFAFFFDSLTFLFSAAAIGLMAMEGGAVRPEGSWQKQAVGVVRDLREGLAYVQRRVDIRTLFGLFFLMATALGSINYLLADFVKTGLRRGPEAYALIDGAIVAGFSLGSIAVTLSRPDHNRIAMLGLGLFGMGAGNMVLAAGGRLPYAVLGGLIGGLFNPVYYVASRTYMQEKVPNELLGRIFSLQFLVLQVGFVASVGLAALGVPRLGVRSWLFWSGVALALVGGLTRVGVLGRLRRDELVVQA